MIYGHRRAANRAKARTDAARSSGLPFRAALSGEVTDIADKRIKEQIESMQWGRLTFRSFGGREREIENLGGSDKLNLSTLQLRRWPMPCARRIWKSPAEELTKARVN